MEKMALVACLFSACVNWTRDGKNPEDELMRKDGKHRQRAIIVRENPHDGVNSHINMHASWVTLSSLGACSSPLGVCCSPQRNLG
jgi:hypothetical protein